LRSTDARQNAARSNKNHAEESARAINTIAADKLAIKSASSPRARPLSHLPYRDGTGRIIVASAARAGTERPTKTFRRCVLSATRESFVRTAIEPAWISRSIIVRRVGRTRNYTPALRSRRDFYGIANKPRGSRRETERGERGFRRGILFIL